MLGKKVKVKVDRPIGSCHPKHKDLYYPINYGYIEGVFAPDGEEQDAYILGVDQPLAEFEGVVIAVIHRKNDVEDKWVVAPEGKMFTKEEIENAVRFQEQFFDSHIIMKAQQPAAPCEIKQIGLQNSIDAMAKLGRDESVPLETLEKICGTLNCSLKDIVEICEIDNHSY